MSSLRLPLLLAALAAAPLAPAMAQSAAFIACVVNTDASFNSRVMMRADPLGGGSQTGDSAWVEVAKNGGRHCRNFSASRVLNIQLEENIAGWRPFTRCNQTIHLPARNITLTIFRESRVRLGCRIT